MASRYLPTNRAPVCRKAFLFCLSCTIIVVLPYLFLWFYDRKEMINYVFPKEKIFTVTQLPENDTTSERDNVDEPSSSLDKNEPAGELLDQCDPSKALLKVFMYDMPPEFHFGLLDWESDGNSLWPDIRKKIPIYPGGLNLQHSIEYWLTLDLLSSRFPDRKGPCSAVRVEDSREDVVSVPFFSSLSFNPHSKIKRPVKISKNRLLQQKLLKFLTAQEWKRSGGVTTL